MGTKNDPGKFDCYGEAYPDEPLFILRASDQRAPLIVRIWAEAYRDHKRRYEMWNGEAMEKYSEALNVATAMEAWYRAKILGVTEEGANVCA